MFSIITYGNLFLELQDSFLNSSSTFPIDTKTFTHPILKVLNPQYILVNGQFLYQIAQVKMLGILLDSAFSLILPHPPILQTLRTLQLNDLLRVSSSLILQPYLAPRPISVPSQIT